MPTSNSITATAVCESMKDGSVNTAILLCSSGVARICREDGQAGN